MQIADYFSPKWPGRTPNERIRKKYIIYWLLRNAKQFKYISDL